jgi:hypothetical protein
MRKGCCFGYTPPKGCRETVKLESKRGKFFEWGSGGWEAEHSNPLLIHANSGCDISFLFFYIEQNRKEKLRRQ